MLILQVQIFRVGYFVLFCFQKNKFIEEKEKNLRSVSFIELENKVIVLNYFMQYIEGCSRRYRNYQNYQVNFIGMWDYV